MAAPVAAHGEDRHRPARRVGLHPTAGGDHPGVPVPRARDQAVAGAAPLATGAAAHRPAGDLLAWAPVCDEPSCSLATPASAPSTRPSPATTTSSPRPAANGSSPA